MPPPGQYPAAVQPPGEYQGSVPPPSQYPAQPPGQYQTHVPPPGQYPGAAQPAGPYPGSVPGQYPGGVRQPGSYPGGGPSYGQYPGAGQLPGYGQPYGQYSPPGHAQQYPPPGLAQQYPRPGQYPGPPGVWQPVPPWAQQVREPRVVAAPPETPYHRLARTAKHRWWRPIIGTLVFGLGAVVLTVALLIPWMIVHSILSGNMFEETQGDNLFANTTEEIAFALTSLGILTLAVLFVVRFVQRRPIGSVVSVLGRMRWRWLLTCCAAALAFVAVSFGVGIVVEQLFPSTDAGAADDGSWVGWGRFVLPALIIICLVPFQSAAEEFVFRGWVIQAVGAYGPDRVEGRAQWLKRLFRTPWPGIAVSSVLFVSAHGYTDWALVDIFVFATLVGWLTVRTGGLEAAIALHVLNNLAAFLVPAATGQLDGWDVQGSAPWTVLLVDLPAFAVFGVLVVWLARRNRIARFSRAQD